MIEKSDFLPTDIVPMVNYAWDWSFVRVGKNLNAIRDRGWGPLNYALLNEDQIQETMTGLESKSYALMMKPTSNTNT